MLRLLFWIAVLGALLLVLDGTLPVPGIARDEVVYATPPPVASCGPSGCIAVYTLEVGNVGRARQEAVRVRLRTDALTTPVILPTVRRASDATLSASAEERPGVEAFPLGPLDSEERVTLVFALRAPSRESVAGWDRLLVDVAPAAGSARPGDVGALSGGRLLHAAGRIAARITEAVRKAVASS
jgi:hypothetical protein